ncbi:N-acetylmuramoyl-L-alanine amidase family protein, partial [Paenibacillus larvae]|nr:N-acetylmuramoyl-L-alanine amidase family protein [Paenibacillus larvae]
MEIREMLVDPSKYGIKCPNKMAPKYITYHNTANDALAENEIRYMIGNNN